MFAKLFENEKYGQVLVTKDTNDEDAPQIKITFDFEGMIVKYAPTYANSDEGIENRDFYFSSITEEQVMANVEADC
jgi:hypothetical protein